MFSLLNSMKDQANSAISRDSETHSRIEALQAANVELLRNALEQTEPRLREKEEEHHVNSTKAVAASASMHNSALQSQAITHKMEASIANFTADAMDRITTFMGRIDKARDVDTKSLVPKKEVDKLRAESTAKLQSQAEQV